MVSKLLVFFMQNEQNDVENQWFQAKACTSSWKIMKISFKMHCRKQFSSHLSLSSLVQLCPALEGLGGHWTALDSFGQPWTALRSLTASLPSPNPYHKITDSDFEYLNLSNSDLSNWSLCNWGLCNLGFCNSGFCNSGFYNYGFCK